MQRLLEIILGLEKGFLSREGEFTLQFNPHWPGQEWVGAASWNIVLAIVALALVIYVYRREGRSRPVRGVPRPSPARYRGSHDELQPSPGEAPSR